MLWRGKTDYYPTPFRLGPSEFSAAHLMLKGVRGDETGRPEPPASKLDAARRAATPTARPKLAPQPEPTKILNTVHFQAHGTAWYGLGTALVHAETIIIANKDGLWYTGTPWRPHRGGGHPRHSQSFVALPSAIPCGEA